MKKKIILLMLILISCFSCDCYYYIKSVEEYPTIVTSVKVKEGKYIYTINYDGYWRLWPNKLTIKSDYDPGFKPGDILEFRVKEDIHE